MADVTGHGVPAALIASMIKMAMPSVVPCAHDPREMLRGLNRILFGQLRRRFDERFFHYRASNPELGSADLMPRNLDRRVEVLFPVNGRELIQQVKNEILDLYLADTVKAKQMRSDGSYVRRTARRGKAVNSQEAFIQNRKSVKK